MLRRFEEDLKTALKAGNKRRVGTLRLLIAGLKNERIALQREPTDAEAEALLRKAVKQRRDSIEQYAKGNRPDLVSAEEEEIRVIEEYLPKGMTDAEIEQAAREVIGEKGFASARDAGLVMKELMARHRGRMDGRRAQEIVRRLLP